MVTAKSYEDSDELDGIDSEEVDAVEDDEEETPKAKTKPGKAKAASKDSDEDEEEEAPRKKAAVGVKSKGKEKTTVKTSKNEKHRGTAKGAKVVKMPKHKTVRGRRTGDRPFLDDSIVGRAFKLAEKGLTLAKLKQFVEDQEAQPWVISFLRKGDRNGFTWTVTEENGRFQISNLRKPKTAKAA